MIIKFPPAITFSFTAKPGIPRTGQTISYVDYDDGAIKAGFPGTRFGVSGDGTIIDVHTSLMWVQQPQLIIPGVISRLSQS